jgi:putative ABC transport system permease protein
MVNKDYGFNEQHIINVRLQGMEMDKLANEVKSLPGVISVGGVSHALGTWADRSSDYKRNREDEPFTMRDFIVDNNYIDNIGLSFIAGSNFDPSLQGDHERHIILNEKALSFFGFADPVSAMGQSVFVNDSVMLTVIGVVKDFNFRPLNYEIGPLALRYNTSQLDWLSVKVLPNQQNSVMASVESIWKKLDPVHPFEGMMMDDQIDGAYESAGFFDILNIVGYISFLTISMACMGMLGMAMYSSQTRIKEIGVRKVMGASSGQITMLLSQSFILLMGMALIPGIPLAWLLGDQFLSMYAYKTSISLPLILAGVGIVVLAGLITIGSQTWRAASSNPVDSLRHE